MNTNKLYNELIAAFHPNFALQMKGSQDCDKITIEDYSLAAEDSIAKTVALLPFKCTVVKIASGKWEVRIEPPSKVDQLIKIHEASLIKLKTFKVLLDTEKNDFRTHALAALKSEVIELHQELFKLISNETGDLS